MAQIVSVFRQYCGSGFYPLIFIAALIWLLVTEKRKIVRIVLVDASLVILILFFLPPFKALMDVLDEGTYYRILWLLPMTVVIAYAGVRIFEKNRAAGCVVLLVLILSGDYVYDNINVTKAQNRYHIPNAVIAICNEIMPAEDEERVPGGTDLLCTSVQFRDSDALWAGNAGASVGMELGYPSHI